MSIRNIISKICENVPSGVAFRAWWRKRANLRAVQVRRQLLRKYGPEILERVDRVAERLKVPYFIDYGTLLGYARENAFIKHDDDIDFGVAPGFREKTVLARALLDEGFSFKKGFVCEGILTEYAFTNKGASVDFFFYAQVGNRTAVNIYATGGLVPTHDQKCRTTSAVRTFRPIPGDFKKVSFEGAVVVIPGNYEELLMVGYGSNWRHPVPNWRPDSNDPNRQPLTSDSFVVGLDYVLSGSLG